MSDSKIQWFEDWHQALTEAKMRKLPVLLDFYLPG